MGKPVVKLNLPGVNRLMRAEKVQEIVHAEAEKIAAAAGPEFEVADSLHRYTARSFVRAKGIEGMRQEARNKVLTRAAHG